MDRFKYIALESSGSGISPNFENDRNAKANRREDRRKGNARVMEKKKMYSSISLLAARQRVGRL